MYPPCPPFLFPLRADLHALVTAGRPLNSPAQNIGFVKILSQLSPEDRSSIKPEALLIPDASGPYLVPAPSLVYDDAP